METRSDGRRREPCCLTSLYLWSAERSREERRPAPPGTSAGEAGCRPSPTWRSEPLAPSHLTSAAATASLRVAASDRQRRAALRVSPGVEAMAGSGAVELPLEETIARTQHRRDAERRLGRDPLLLTVIWRASLSTRPWLWPP
ncbi:unnamed protein product [Lampetra planeri]